MCNGSFRKSKRSWKIQIEINKNLIENPAANGEYRVFNQFEQTYSIEELAKMVQKAAHELGLQTAIQHYDNPRTEMEKHYYNPDRNRLIELGYQPSHNIVGEITIMLKDLLPYKERILAHKAVLIPDIRWDGTHQRSVAIS